MRRKLESTGEMTTAVNQAVVVLLKASNHARLGDWDCVAQMHYIFSLEDALSSSLEAEFKSDEADLKPLKAVIAGFSRAIQRHEKYVQERVIRRAQARCSQELTKVMEAANKVVEFREKHDA